jgi:prephenate dehydrogenase
MGRWLRRFWRGQGFQVVWSDQQAVLTNHQVVERADLIFVSVPLAATPEVLRDLAPRVPSHAGLVSIASLMEPSAAVLASCAGEGLCAHPVFGPTVTGARGQPIVLAPVRGDAWLAWLGRALASAGMAVRQSTPAEHDASMAIIQALLHSLFVALCGTMEAGDLPPEVAMGLASPTMRLELGLAARILSQDPALYAELVVGNRAAPAQLDRLAEALRRLAALARAGDREAFAAAFLSARESFGASLAPLAARAEAALDRFG